MTSARRLSAGFCASLLLAAGCSKDPERAKQMYVESGDRFAANQQYSQAILQYRNALQQDARFGEARLKLAEAYEKTGDVPNAVREYIRAADALPTNVDVQVKAGSLLVVTGQYAEARARAEAALKVDPNSYRAQVLLGNALAGLRDFETAITQLEEAVRLDPSAVAAQTSLGEVLLAQGNREDAEAALRRAVELNPTSPGGHLALANLSWAQGKVDAVEQSLKKVIELDPDNALAHRGLATLYRATRRVADAEPHMKALAAGDSSPGSALKLSLADYYLAADRPEDALKVLQGIVAGEGTSAARTRLAAIQFRRTGKTAGARVIDEVLAKDSKFVPALLMKAQFEIAERRLDSALEYAKRAATAEPQSIHAHYIVGMIQRARQRPVEAAAAFSEVLKTNPRAVAAQIQLAQLNLELGQAEKSLQLATDAARQIPESLRVRLTLIDTLIATGQFDQAERDSRKLLRLLPKVASVHLAAAKLAEAKGKAAEARGAYNQALVLDPDNVDALTALARLDIRAGERDRAVERVETLLARKPDDRGLLMLAARTFGTAGDLARAERYLTKLIELEPSHFQAYVMLAQLYRTQQRTADALGTYETMLRDRGDSAGLQTMVGILHERNGAVSDATRAYQRALQLDPRAVVAANNLAYLYAQHGDNLEMALQLAQTARQQLPESAEVADTLGWVYVKKDLASLAIPQLEFAATRQPQSAVTQYHLGVALSKAGDHDRARQALERALSLNLSEPNATDARKLVSQS